ncbi:MAG: 7-cyano-7-deazaguanine synthase QueC [Nitrospirota bacterium]
MLDSKYDEDDMKKAVVLLSGGIDSTTTMAIAKEEGYELYALSFNYGQRHRIELESAKKIAKSLGAKKHLIIIFDLRKIGGSALTSHIEIPKTVRSYKSEVRSIYTKKEELKIMNSESQPSTIPITYVPARNTIFLSFALAWAEVLDAEDIFIGANSLDYSGYPDCRPEYMRAFENMANLATKASVEGKKHFIVKTPLIKMTKADIIKKGLELGVDYGITCSCYDPTPEGFPCGTCDSCNFREKGFYEAGIKDPLIKNMSDKSKRLR